MEFEVFMAETDNLDEMLEKIEGKQLEEHVDLSILQNAQDYNVDLQSLEIAAEPKQKKIVKTNQKDESWAGLDVKLLDVANLIFDYADYPVFIIQDDNIVYANEAVRNILQISDENEIIKHKFLESVYKEDWNLLADNIGEMLTNHKELVIRFTCRNNKIKELNLKAIYLSDIEHFSFILLGDKIKTKSKSSSSSVLYDEDTGLPNFFLFEDRLQMAILAVKSVKDKNQNSGIAVLSVVVNNIDDFKKLNLQEMVIKKLTDNLVFNLPKTVTVSRGLKYHFWILINGWQDGFDLDYYIRRVKEVLDGGVSDNFVRHDLAYSIGGSVFKEDAFSAKELIEHTIAAVRQSQSTKQNEIVIYKNKA